MSGNPNVCNFAGPYLNAIQNGHLHDSTAVELDADYFRLAEKAIPRLAALYTDFKGAQFEMEAGRDSTPRPDANQLDFVMADKSAAYGSAKRQRLPDAL